jgi:hypothetical protein
VLSKLVRGAAGRKTRFHDEIGNRIPIGRIIANGPRALLGAVWRRTLGYHPTAPWISFDATRRI